MALGSFVPNAAAKAASASAKVIVAQDELLRDLVTPEAEPVATPGAPWD